MFPSQCVCIPNEYRISFHFIMHLYSCPCDSYSISCMTLSIYFSQMVGMHTYVIYMNEHVPSLFGTITNLKILIATKILFSFLCFSYIYLYSHLKIAVISRWNAPTSILPNKYFTLFHLTIQRRDTCTFHTQNLHTYVHNIIKSSILYDMFGFSPQNSFRTFSVESNRRLVHWHRICWK